jgi:hypothetical protein
MLLEEEPPRQLYDMVLNEKKEFAYIKHKCRKGD